jgi:hypothetical protein
MESDAGVIGAETEGHEVALVAILDTGVPSVRDLSAMDGWDDTRGWWRPPIRRAVGTKSRALAI